MLMLILSLYSPKCAKWTSAKLFEKSGKTTPMFIRFSTVVGEKGSADSERDPRGFAVKFYTEEGNWDLVGNNTQPSSSRMRSSSGTLFTRRSAIPKPTSSRRRGASPNYEPNSFGGPTEDPKYLERPRTIASAAVGRYNHRDDSDFYTQPGNLFRLMKPQEKERLIGNIVASLSNAPRNIQERQLYHFFRADPAYGEGVAKPLGIPVKKLAAAK